MDIRRRMINTPPPTADNVFVIDSITFEEINIFSVTGYHSKTENINTMNSLKNFFVENGVYNDYYELDPSKIELYLYDYKIPAIQLYYHVGDDIVTIYSSEGVFPNSYCDIRNDNTITNSWRSIDGEWTFDHIPTTSVEAILFVEFAKQYGVDAIKTSGFNGITASWNEENKSLYMIKGAAFEYIIYGAGNGELTGHIEELFGGN